MLMCVHSFFVSLNSLQTRCLKFWITNIGNLKFEYLIEIYFITFQQAFMKGILKLKGNMMLAQKLGELLKPAPTGSAQASKVPYTSSNYRNYLKVPYTSSNYRNYLAHLFCTCIQLMTNKVNVQILLFCYVYGWYSVWFNKIHDLLFLIFFSSHHLVAQVCWVMLCLKIWPSGQNPNLV